jgi:hypothetical protein
MTTKQKYIAYINYDAIPSDGFNYQVEIGNNDFEAVDFISVMDDTDETVEKVFKEWLKGLKIT